MLPEIQQFSVDLKNLALCGLSEKKNLKSYMKSFTYECILC